MYLEACVGLFTGLFVAAAQFPYGLYVIAQNMRESRYSWLSTALIVVGVSPLWLGISAVFTVLQSVASVVLSWKMIVMNDIRWGFIYPIVIEQHYQNRRDINRSLYLSEYSTLGKLVYDLGALCMAPLNYLFNCNNRSGNFYIPQEEQMALLRIQPARNPALGIQTKNKRLIERIRTLKKLQQGIVLPLTENEITAFKALKQDNAQLEKYTSSESCPLTLNWPQDPVTVVLNDTSEKVYECAELIQFIKACSQNNQTAFEPTSRINLTSLKLYRGYPHSTLQFIQEVRERITQPQEPSATPQSYAAMYVVENTVPAVGTDTTSCATSRSPVG